MALEDRVPMRWPAGWTGPAALEALKGTPVNYIVAGGQAGILKEPAAKFGITVVETPPAEVSVVDGVWPGMRVTQGRARDEADSGPTGAPWVDSNGWIARLARARSSKPVWLAFEPPKDLFNLTADRFQLAVADVAVGGGRWLITWDEKTAAAIGRGDAAALEMWRQTMLTVAYFEKRKAWRDWVPMGPLAVISDFSGDNEFMGTEVLNLASRRNLLYRVVDKARAAEADLSGLRTVLWVDKDIPAPPLLEKLTGFARGGGLVVAPAPVAAKFAGAPAPSPIDSYEVRALGKGRIAAPRKEWDDPFVVAADTHILTSRRYDPVYIFNAGSMFLNCAERGPESVVELVNFARRGSANQVSVVVPRKNLQARLCTLTSGPVSMTAEVAARGVEFHLPRFSVYAALELRRA